MVGSHCTGWCVLMIGLTAVVQLLVDHERKQGEGKWFAGDE